MSLARAGASHRDDQHSHAAPSSQGAMVEGYLSGDDEDWAAGGSQGPIENGYLSGDDEDWEGQVDGKEPVDRGMPPSLLRRLGLHLRHHMHLLWQAP
jgi:hypothetical protein